jgi:4-amino-4-deoxy-L-arabinose transferase-like glycosyltransferase
LDKTQAFGTNKDRGADPNAVMTILKKEFSREILFLVLMGFITLFVNLRQLPAYGLFVEETFATPLAVEMAFGYKEGVNPHHVHNPGGLRLLDRPLPLANPPYNGPTKYYFYAVIFKLFGVSPESIRVPNTIVSIIGLIVFFFVLKNLYGKTIAYIATLFLGVDLYFVTRAMFDMGPSNIQFLLGILIFWLVFKQLNLEKNDWRLVLPAFFLAGLGLTDKKTFVFFLIAIFIASMVLYPKRFIKVIFSKEGALSQIFFAVGLLPILIYFIKDYKGQCDFINSQLTSQSASGIHTFIPRIKTLFDGLEKSILYLTIEPGFLLAPLLIKISLMFVLIYIVYSIMKFLIAGKKVLNTEGMSLIYLLTLLISYSALFHLLFPNNFFIHHLYIVLPYLYVILAVSIYKVVNSVRDPSLINLALRTAVAFMIACSVFINMTIFHRHMEQLSKNGVFARELSGYDHTLTIYDVVEFAEDYPFRKNKNIFSFMTWGGAAVVSTLTSNTVWAAEEYWHIIIEPDDKKKLEITKEILLDKNKFFVFQKKRGTWITPDQDYLDVFNFIDPQIAVLLRTALEELNMRLVPVKQFYDKDNRGGWEIYKIGNIRQGDSVSP